MVRTRLPAVAWIGVAWCGLLARGLGARAAEPAHVPAAQAESHEQESRARAAPLRVTPEGPTDGGDFGPHTPGTRTSGLQEAFDAAKRLGRDVYLGGGSWTLDHNQPVVYVLNETLRIPWMQDFRLDSGHCVIHYAPVTGDAVVFDSQMSCAYRFGLIVSMADGAVVRLAPTTAGPDRFRVITSSEFHFNALVGGGGAWPGGEPFAQQLNTQHRWVGTGLLLDALAGSIDTNQIHVTEVVGCARGVALEGPCTHNRLSITCAHLCATHLELGSATDGQPHGNLLTGHFDSQGVPQAVGARIGGFENQLTLSFGRLAPDSDVVFEPPARDNLITVLNLPSGWTNRAVLPTNRFTAARPPALPRGAPPPAASGEELLQAFPWTIEVRILEPGQVRRWRETTSTGETMEFAGGFHVGQSLVLRPGDRLALEYDSPPRWAWKTLP